MFCSILNALDRHNSEKEWFDNFLLVWINKIKKALKKDGILALNINQFNFSILIIGYNFIVGELAYDLDKFF